MLAAWGWSILVTRSQVLDRVIWLLLTSQSIIVTRTHTHTHTHMSILYFLWSVIMWCINQEKRSLYHCPYSHTSQYIVLRWLHGGPQHSTSIHEPAPPCVPKSCKKHYTRKEDISNALSKIVSKCNMDSTPAGLQHFGSFPRNGENFWVLHLDFV